jgi:predicted transcriptional regulator
MTESLLAVLVLQSLSDRTIEQKAVLLSAAGLDQASIASLLSTTPHAVAQYLYKARKGKAAKKRGKAGRHETA